MGQFLVRISNGVGIYTSELLNAAGVRHFFSTSLGGVSKGCYESLNLGVYTDDKPENVNKNITIAFNAANMQADKAVYLKQIHGKDIYEVNKENCNQIKGIQGDGLITAERGIAIGVFTADCVPILLFDTEKKVAAALHGGWKGTAAKIVQGAIELMHKRWNTDPEKIIAAIGPSIGPCCFQVGEDVAARFSTASEHDGSYYVDLPNENRIQLLSYGVLEENISMSGICTSCSNQPLYSYRRYKGKTGRMGSFIQIL